MKVLVATQPMPAADFIEAILARAPELELLEYRSALDDDALRDVDAVLAWQMPRGLPARLPRLRWVCSVAAGVEKLLVPDLAANVRVSRIVDREQAAGMAQFVVAMALRHARDLERYEAQQRERAWLRRPTPIARHRVAVLGTGATGGEIAAWLARSGLVVRGWNRRSPEALHALLAQSDIVVCALPLTRATEGILDAAAFAAMPRGGYVINDARGAHVVEPDLLDALDAGQLRRAVLDVFAVEPLPAEHRFWSHPRITLLPHVAALTDVRSAAQLAAANVRALRAGQPIAHLVDRTRGY